MPGAGAIHLICDGDWSQCGHYTQGVWFTTTDLGCGFARDQFIALVCRYSPPGNMFGQQVLGVPPGTNYIPGTTIALPPGTNSINDNRPDYGHAANSAFIPRFPPTVANNIKIGQWGDCYYSERNYTNILIASGKLPKDGFGKDGFGLHKPAPDLPIIHSDFSNWFSGEYKWVPLGHIFDLDPPPPIGAGQLFNSYISNGIDPAIANLLVGFNHPPPIGFSPGWIPVPLSNGPLGTGYQYSNYDPVRLNDELGKIERQEAEMQIFDHLRQEFDGQWLRPLELGSGSQVAAPGDCKLFGLPFEVPTGLKFGVPNQSLRDLCPSPNHHFVDNWGLGDGKPPIFIPISPATPNLFGLPSDTALPFEFSPHLPFDQIPPLIPPPDCPDPLQFNLVDALVKAAADSPYGASGLPRESGGTSSGGAPGPQGATWTTTPADPHQEPITGIRALELAGLLEAAGTALENKISAREPINPADYEKLLDEAKKEWHAAHEEDEKSGGTLDPTVYNNNLEKAQQLVKTAQAAAEAQTVDTKVPQPELPTQEVFDPSTAPKEPLPVM